MQTAVKYEGAKALKCYRPTGVDGSLKRADVIGGSAGDVFFAFRFTSNTVGQLTMRLRTGAGADQARLYIGAQKIMIYTGSDFVDMVTGLSIDTWYICHWRLSGSTQDVRYYNGSEWSAFAGVQNCEGNGYTDLLLEYAASDSTNAVYLDLFTPTNPNPSALTLQAAAGAFTLTGNAATLTSERTMHCETGVFTLTGNAVASPNKWKNASKSAEASVVNQEKHE